MNLAPAAVLLHSSRVRYCVQTGSEWPQQSNCQSRAQECKFTRVCVTCIERLKMRGAGPPPKSNQRKRIWFCWTNVSLWDWYPSIQLLSLQLVTVTTTMTTHRENVKGGLQCVAGRLGSNCCDNGERGCYRRSKFFRVNFEIENFLVRVLHVLRLHSWQVRLDGDARGDNPGDLWHCVTRFKRGHQ